MLKFTLRINQILNKNDLKSEILMVKKGVIGDNIINLNFIKKKFK